MESVNIPSENVPAELKSCDQILKRAKELKKAEPVVAYWCKLGYFRESRERADS
jgi:vacuolar protein sorting-associated protein VTA1